MKIILTLFILIISNNYMLSQGCADGGACTIDSFSPSHMSKKNQTTLAVGTSTGLADYDILILGNYVSYVKELSKDLSLELKMTSLMQSGNDITRWGLSDAFFNLSYRIDRNNAFTVGYKYPINYANKKKDGNSLPMDYQSSLGTQDLLIVYSYSRNELHLAIGSQIVLKQNSNEFNPINFPESSRLSEFQNTFGFQRSHDIILRASYLFKANEKFAITPTIIPIYHIANDEFVSEIGEIQNNIEIEGSSGLTLNIGSYFDFKISKDRNLRLSLAAPILVRDSRPEGLTRAFVATVEYKFFFN